MAVLVLASTIGLSGAGSPGLPGSSQAVNPATPSTRPSPVSFELKGLHGFPDDYFELILRSTGPERQEFRALDGYMPPEFGVLHHGPGTAQFHIPELADGEYEVSAVAPVGVVIDLGSVTVGPEVFRQYSFVPDFGPHLRRVQLLVPGEVKIWKAGVRVWSDALSPTAWMFVGLPETSVVQGSGRSAYDFKLLALPGSVLDLEISAPSCVPMRLGFDGPQVKVYPRAALAAVVTLDVLPKGRPALGIPTHVALLGADLLGSESEVRPLVLVHWKRVDELNWTSPLIGDPPYSACWITGVRDEPLLVRPISDGEAPGMDFHLTLPQSVR